MEKKVQRLKQDKKAFFYPRDFQKILDLASEKQRFTLLVLINTGARINEARHIELQDMDHLRKNLTLRITKVRSKKKEKRPDPRTIALSSKFYRYLKKNILDKKVHSTPATGQFLKKLAKDISLINWQDYSAHNIRKTFGTWMLALGIDGFKLSQHLGHDPNTLRTQYASPDIFNSEDKDRMREILGDLPARLRN